MRVSTGDAFFRSLRHSTKEHMLAAATRPSYRAIFALYLFSMTPAPEPDIGDGISEACLDASETLPTS